MSDIGKYSHQVYKKHPGPLSRGVQATLGLFVVLEQDSNGQGWSAPSEARAKLVGTGVKRDSKGCLFTTERVWLRRRVYKNEAEHNSRDAGFSLMRSKKPPPTTQLRRSGPFLPQSAVP